MIIEIDLQKNNKIKPIIYTWYEDWDDFCSEWCDDIGYTHTEARKILHGGKGEFIVYSNGEIVRLRMGK